MTDGPGVKVDEAHCDLLSGLVRAQKPESILEFGYGGGGSLSYLKKAAFDNGNSPTYDLVENWTDWGSYAPVDCMCDDNLRGVHIWEMDEGNFVTQCNTSFDFIMSDADHVRTQDYFTDVYHRLLNPGGILCYHDVCNYPNIWEIVEECKRRGLSYRVFNKNSQPWEACFRGLLCIFKPD